MRIAFISLGFLPFRTSGLDVSGERLVRAMLEAGHHVTVISGTRSGITEVYDHPSLVIHRVPLRSSDWIGFSLRAARLLKTLHYKTSFDVVHFWDIHFAFSYSGRFLGSLHQSFRQRLNSLRWSHLNPFSSIYRFSYYSLARVLAEIPSIHRASGLLAGSSTTREEYINHYRVSPDRIALARHGIDTTFFRRSNATDYLHSKLGIARDEPIVLFAGFITPRKGLEYLARALPLIQPSPRLVIIGCWRSEKYRKYIFQILGPASKQVVEVGFVPDEYMPLCYSSADVYVSPSLLEGFGLPLAEALACETPIVATNTGATAEVVGPGGIMVPPGDIIALAGAISDLLKDASLRHELGKRGREYIASNFSIQTMLYSTIEAYTRF